ncbi:class I SAM-dependent methyltransferase [Dyadobacter arcticus]|uniref:Ubiquinone/menaquinone biosynthesis C-methylase UbiE n=1 Tax=Dyadobacter arcticus TaxID=1078754 RepID=A0ABX0UL13_9BACT|nr:class I SAM-dependent methyltransferase [Dyadobacter arcticus]NIJ52689.1 ubiquinone/menaquinone biosynthesis C-methylase UbiE [Dyadobacter arcticus]
MTMQKIHLMEANLKKNVQEFNKNVAENGGFLYTTNATFSSHVANKRISDEIFKLIKPHYKTLLDIGCGDGTYTYNIKQNFPNLEVHGFDPAESAIQIATKNYPSILFKTTNLLDDSVPLPEKKYDVAVIRGVLHHLTDQQKAIENAFKFADNVIIMEPNGNNPVLKLIEKTSAYHIEHEEQSFYQWQLKRWIKDAGGEIVEWKYVGYVPFFFPTAPAKIIYFFQPFLEKIPVLKHIFSAQFIIACRKRK